MTLLQTPLTLLDEACAAHPTALAIRSASQDAVTLTHRDTSYATLQNDINTSAAYWKLTLGEAKVDPKSVVGLWLKGVSYQDLLQIWGILWAGYIPQLFSLRLTDPSVIYELLIKGEAAALICDSVFAPILQECPVPTFHAQDISSLDNIQAPDSTQKSVPEADEVLMVYHTSGSTSGAPKLVPLTTKWLDCLIRKIRSLGPRFPCSKDQFINVLLGSLAHMGSAMHFLEVISRGGCYILPTALPYPGNELRHMIHRCGLTRLSMFPPFLSIVFVEARRDESLIKDLQRLDEIAYGGLPLNPSDIAWAHQQGLSLIDALGSTEVGLLMVNKGRGNLNLAPFSDSKYEFIPFQGTSAGDDDQLLELAVLPSSLDCPTLAFRDDDGKFHTGDLFLEVAPGQYKFKGRNDDWIKMQMALRCDTASIEAEAVRTCAADLISVVVVIGEGRPSPAMIVELKDDTSAHSGDTEHRSVAVTNIFHRMAPFFKRRYMHERIGDKRLILVAPSGTLPRTVTKGGIRRKEVEKMYGPILDKIFVECA